MIWGANHSLQNHDSPVKMEGKMTWHSSRPKKIAWRRVEEESTPGLACWALSQARCFLGQVQTRGQSQVRDLKATKGSKS